jgi:hypothetical protein
MKKLIFILFVMISSTVLSAQKQYQIYANQTGDWNGKSWKFSDIKEVNMTLTVQGRAVLISDMANSSYYCYANKDENTFYAYDEKNRQCFIIFNSDEGWNLIGVVYDNFLVRYFYR